MAATVSARPRILITRAEEVVGERWEDYADAVETAGGAAVPLDLDRFEDEVPRFDGLVVTAGVDLDPSRYGQERSARVREINAERDRFEEAVIAAALSRERPLFCICRGHQIFNTSQGGSLIQHLEDREPHRARYGEDRETIESGWHDVTVAPGSLLARVSGEEMLRVNSRHHQAVPSDGVAADLVRVAWTPDGVVEALEAPGQGWALSVQWHPERSEMLADPALRSGSVALFEAFVEAARVETAQASS
jgi:putative glutamine amidotransferase